MREKKFQGLIDAFAHIPWEDTPNFQKKHPDNERNSFSFPEGVKRCPTNVSSRGVCDIEILEGLIDETNEKPTASNHLLRMVSWNLNIMRFVSVMKDTLTADQLRILLME